LNLSLGEFLLSLVTSVLILSVNNIVIL